jgi:predicted PurR-regulated permease PerM
MLAHGILGLFVGPIILAVTWELIMAWIREERTEAAASPAIEQGTEKLAAKA